MYACHARKYTTLYGQLLPSISLFSHFFAKNLHFVNLLHVAEGITGYPFCNMGPVSLKIYYKM